MLSHTVMLCALSLAGAQKAGTLTAESSPTVSLQQCTKSFGCSARQSKLTMDANWRWSHAAAGWQNCYKDKEWVSEMCPTPEACAANCALDGISSEEYKSTYGVTEITDGVELKFVSTTEYGNTYGSRLYMMDGTSSYYMFKLKNREFTLDVDMTKLPCGLNGAVYFVEMDKLGGQSATNQAGAKMGTGYCDAQCPHDIKWMNGEANSKNWDSTSDPPTGHYGMCCAEMDIWEANKMATAYTPHPCNLNGPERCEGVDCGDNDKGQRYQGVCDKDGCDFNSYRMGEESFYQPGSQYKVDTTKPITVVTQFLTSDGSDTGDLVEIRRFYVQDGIVIPNSNATIMGGGNSITDSWCSSQKSTFGDLNDFAAKGALKQMGEALDRGMVLALSLWDDTQVNMLWLDSAYPADQPRTKAGVARGPCLGGASSTPSFLRETYPDATVRYSNIKVGEIGATTAARRRLDSSVIV